jgi:translation initiation factor IF-3
LADGLDLALVNEKLNPPIVKLVNYGKLLYEQKKNLKKQRSNIVKNK